MQASRPIYVSGLTPGRENKSLSPLGRGGSPEQSGLWLGLETPTAGSSLCGNQWAFSPRPAPWGNVGFSQQPPQPAWGSRLLAVRAAAYLLVAGLLRRPRRVQVAASVAGGPWRGGDAQAAAPDPTGLPGAPTPPHPTPPCLPSALPGGPLVSSVALSALSWAAVGGAAARRPTLRAGSGEAGWGP